MKPLSICVAGWYGMPCCYGPLAASGYPVQVVAHRKVETCGLPVVVIDNIGLEFGAYEHYRQNLWNKRDHVLFMHDDIQIQDIGFIDEIPLDRPIVMIWMSIHQLSQNLCHGRAFVARADYLKDHPFWFDRDNHGYIDLAHRCNRAAAKLFEATLNITTHHFTNKLKMGRRGKLP